MPVRSPIKLEACSAKPTGTVCLFTTPPPFFFHMHGLYTLYYCYLLTIERLKQQHDNEPYTIQVVTHIKHTQDIPPQKHESVKQDIDCWSIDIKYIDPYQFILTICV